MAEATAAAIDALFRCQSAREFLGPEGGLLRYFIDRRGHRLCSSYWPSHTPTKKAVLLLVHGHGSYIQYEYLKFQVI